MKVQTERFGTLEVDANEVIEFPEGILGFGDYHKYILIEQEESFFVFLQSVEEPNLAFVMMQPELLRPEYEVVLEGHEVESIQLTSAEDGRVYAILTIPEDLADMTANLQAPIVINSKKRLAKQIVLMDGKYHTRHNVLAEIQKSAFQQSKQKKLRKTV